jgi:predicted dehydrogenase
VTLRFGVVGPGFIGRVHAQAIQAAEGAELVAAVGTHAARLAAFCDELGARPCGSLDELLADDGVDVVVIATPNDLHVPQALACLEAGRHVLLEKPMACDRAAAESLVARARALDRRVLIGHLWRFDREAQRLRAAVAEGAIGRVVKTKGYGVHVNWGPSGWFVESARAGGGALIDMGVHAIDTVRYLLGDPLARAVYARIGTHFGDYAVDDHGILLITWEGGVESLIECGWWNPHADGLEASTQIFGTRGYARLFPTELVQIIDGKPQPRPLELPAREQHLDPHIFVGQIAELCAAIREEREPQPGPGHGVEVLRICEAAYRSSREERRVALEELA